MTLLLKLVLVPGLIALVTLAGRRFGLRIGGWLNALPMVAGAPSRASSSPGASATVFNVPAPPAGFLVKTVGQGSMAWNMGLQGADGIVTIAGKEIPVGGDIILSVEDIPVVSEENIEKIRNTLATLAGVAPGAPVKMNVLRAGKIIELTGTSR